MSLSRAARRRMERLQPAIDRVTDADARFFDRRPDRTHRLRFASAAEMQANALASGYISTPTEPGMCWYCVVRQVTPGVRCRVFLQNEPGLDTDVPEEHAAFVYGIGAPPGSQAHRIEQQIRAALATRDVA